MSFILAIVVGAAAGGLMGLLAGWLARGREEVVVEHKITETIEKIIEKIPEDFAGERDRASAALQQVQELTDGVSQKIDAHNKTVGDINQELTAANTHESAAVVEAIRKLIESNNAMQQQLQAAHEKLEDQSHQLVLERERARTDQLTKLRNRRALDDELVKCMAAAENRNIPAVLMMIDVDHFKKFNDTHGHLAGDEVLRSVGRIITEKTHNKPGLFAARYGGEEFALLFSGHSLEAAAQIGERIRTAIGETPVAFDGKNLAVTASAGLSMFQVGQDMSAFLSSSDEALYNAKSSGRNCAILREKGDFRKVVAKPLLSMEKDVPSGLEGQGELSRALTRRIAEWRRGGPPISLVVARIDNLATIESQHGKPALETTMETVCSLFQKSMREMDQVAAVGKECVGVVMPTARLIDAARVAEKLRAAVLASELHTQLAMKVTLSYGVAEVNSEDSADGLITRARRAMEAARRRGGNAVYIHDGVQSDPAADRLDMANWAVVA